MTSFKTTKVVDRIIDATTTTGVLPMDVETFEPADLMDWLKPVTDEDSWGTTDRIFVSDLPWYQRFLIWLFPRMYDIRSYNVEWHVANHNTQEL